MRKATNFEGITDGATLTTSNSGGTSGDNYDAIVIGSGAGLIATSTNAIKETRSAQISTGASAVQCHADYTFTATPTVGRRLYVRTPSSFSTAPTIGRFMSGAGANQVVRFGWNSSGNLLIRNAANSTVATSTTTFSTSTNYRLWLTCTQGLTGSAQVLIYSSIDSTTPLETLTVASGNFGVVDIDAMLVGQVAGLANVPAWLWDGDCVVDSATPIGPATVSASAENASGTGSSGAGTGAEAVNAAPATGAGASNAGTGSVAPNAGVGTATGVANAPTVLTGSATSAPAGATASTGIANPAGVTVAPNAGATSATGAAHQPTPSVAPTTAVASATGTAGSPSANVAGTSGVAAGSGTAHSGVASVSALAGYASATGLANSPYINVGVLAGYAPATGTAYDATADTETQPATPAGIPVATTGRRTPIRTQTAGGRLVATGGTR